MKNIFKTGKECTTDVFFINNKIYSRINVFSHEVIQNPGCEIPIHKSVCANEFSSYEYTTGKTTLEDSISFYSAFALFLSERSKEDYRNKLIEDILKYNLSAFAITSEHLY